DLGKPEFAALNPRQRVPVIVDDGFVLYESAAIVEYLEEKSPGEPRLFASDVRARALQRRMIREIDAYVAPLVEEFAEAVLAANPEPDEVDARAEALRQELARWEAAAAGDYLAGDLSAVDFTLFPPLALTLRIAGRRPGLATGILGARLSAWTKRMEAL